MMILSTNYICTWGPPITKKLHIKCAGTVVQEPLEVANHLNDFFTSVDQ